MPHELLSMLRARKVLDADPPNVPPLGALVRTPEGHLSEVIGWLAPNEEEDSPFAHEHVALLSVLDGAVASPDFQSQDQRQFGFAPESVVTLVKVQDMPRFMRTELECQRAEFFAKTKQKIM